MESHERSTLEAVINTGDLERRASRPPDHRAESLALGEFMEAMAQAASGADLDAILGKLVERALAACRAHSAGVSVLEGPPGSEVFRWRAIAGQWAAFVGGTIPRDASPCAVVIERDAPLSMSRPERHFAIPGGGPPICETLLAPFHVAGEPIGTLWVCSHAESLEFDAEDLRVLTSLSRAAAVAYRMFATQGTRGPRRELVGKPTEGDYELPRAPHAQHPSDTQVEAELRDTRKLHAISSELIRQDGVDRLYDKLVDAAVSIMGSDFASMQMLCGEQNDQLDLLAYRGFPAAGAAQWKRLGAGARSSCGAALRAKRRVVVADIDSERAIFDEPNLRAYAECGIRAMQSTPLVSRGGKLVGMLSTHWSRPHTPSERDFRLFDILARQAADLVERTQAEEKLRQSDRSKDVFLATLAHELRNPLAPIRNSIQLLRRPELKRADAEWAHGVIDRQSRQLERLVDDLLDISRIHRDRLELRLERTDLALVLQSAIDTSRPVIDELGHRLTVELPADPIHVEADPTRLAQIVGNLLNNAAKYSDPGGVIELAARREGDRALVTVRDRGIGIPQQMLQRIFEPFTQVDGSLERTRGGLGIGLTLVKRLVEMHGGTVAAASDGEGKGSEFTVGLPLSKAPARGARAETPAATSAAVGRQRILIVDDNRDAAESLSRMLAGMGHETRTAHDGVKGFELAAEYAPDIALLDVGMPKLNGYDLARLIREQTWGAHMLLVAVTGWGQPADKQHALAAGFDDHMIKPVEPESLLELLATRAT